MAEVGFGEFGTGEVGPSEVGTAEIRFYCPILFSPLLPGFYPLLENR